MIEFKVGDRIKLLRNIYGMVGKSNIIRVNASPDDDYTLYYIAMAPDKGLYSNELEKIELEWTKVYD